MGLCELVDGDKPGHLVIKQAYSGSTTDEMQYFDGKYTYLGPLAFTEQYTDPLLQGYMWYHKFFSYPNCINTLRTYLKRRGVQVKRKGKGSMGVCFSFNTEVRFF